MTKRTELALLWCMPASIVCVFIGMVGSHYWPAPSPAMSAHAYQAFVIAHQNSLRIAVPLQAFAGILTIPFAVAVAREMARIEGRWSVLVWTQFGMGVAGAVTFWAPVLPLACAAYRPHSDPQILRMLNDMYWLPYVMAVWTFIGEAAVTSTLAFRRNNSLPRWYGWVGVACSVGMMTVVLDPFHKTGPFGGRGLMETWWIGVCLCGWWLSTYYVVRRGILARAERPSVEPPARAARVGLGASSAPVAG